MNDVPGSQTNRLIDETSPYLLQHAHNPVDWYPWGTDALAKARADDRPIFLSIGYSACHWCHVMEHESFENADIAQLMNAHFVCIKVDREERPDLDQIYMNSVVALTGRGGWPMSVFLTPDLKPFHGGTYWPPYSKMGMPGFADVLNAVHEAWTDRRDTVDNGAEELTRAVISMASPPAARTKLEPRLLENAQRAILQSADRVHGGFGQAPKFPHPMELRFLLRSWKRFDDDETLDVVRLALDKMADGGLYDHLGGGFHRYSTDEKWLVPHFEKMLYDNALLASTYLEAFQATRSERYERVVRETLDYTLREMTQERGGFYSTQDADSEGVEGKFFVWSEEEIVDCLGAEDARLFGVCYDVSTVGNWEGNNILNRPQTNTRAAEMMGVDETELAELLGRCRQKLFDVRTKRIAPARDDKILVSWNGLMISAMAHAAQVLGESQYAAAAARAADFILDAMRDSNGRLMHAYKDGRARFSAYLDDYACFIEGLVDVYQATFEARFLESAVELSQDMISHFYDDDAAGFFYTPDDHETLIARLKDAQDNATPSGNGMAAAALLRLGRLCGRSDFEEKAFATLEMLSGQLARVPMAAAQSLIAAEFLIGPTYEVAIVDGADENETSAMLDALHARFLPNKVVARCSSGDPAKPIEGLFQGKPSIDGSTTAYLCQRGVCEAPASGVTAFEAALERIG